MPLNRAAAYSEQSEKKIKYEKKNSWAKALVAARESLAEMQGDKKTKLKAAESLWNSMRRDFPLPCDWAHQDAGANFIKWFLDDAEETILKNMIARASDEVNSGTNSKRLKTARGNSIAALLNQYVSICQARREKRLAPLLAKWPRIVFTKRHNLGGSHYAYTEGQSDAQRERNFRSGTALCVLDLKAGAVALGEARSLIDDPQGVIRDPDVSFDGERILFAWKKDLNNDDYHLYEMEVASGEIRQLTFGLGNADYEGVYLPSGDIMFNSTRCVQTVDCWWTEVSNLYRCDKDGDLLRRITFDQIHTNYPTLMEDGRLIYTRWDYNDRGQLYPQPLFQMNPDGTCQTEFYGNNSFFPTTILHARGIPGTLKVMAIAAGHHAIQQGKMIVIDPAKGRQEASGVQLIAPVRKTESAKIDKYGQSGDLFQYPYPLDEKSFLVGFSPSFYGEVGRSKSEHFSLYFMDEDGRREMIFSDPEVSSSQPVPLAPRPRPYLRSSLVDYGKKTGTYYIQDIYQGPGLAGIPRGTIKRIRVVEIRFRAAGIGSNNNRGPAGGALVSTPVAINNGTWDVKVVHGHAKVYEDGSVFFQVPARTPLYFQAVDGDGRVVQSMRSWSTLQPGETFSCVGCHETKNSTPRAALGATAAQKAGPQELEVFYGPARGFSFVKEIQPILDRHCVSCHDGEKRLKDSKKPLFSLLGRENEDKKAKRMWSDSYLYLTQNGKPNEIVNWLNVQSIPPMLAPYYKGSAVSALPKMLEKGHGKTQLSREEIEKICCWIDLLVPYCGDFIESNAWTPAEREMYERFLKKRKDNDKIDRENIKKLIESDSQTIWASSRMP